MSHVQICSEKGAALRQFASGLKSSENYRDEGIRLCEKVRTLLSQEGSSAGITIASTHYGGSIGKHTDLEKPDFDMVLMVNNRRPPFREVLDFWKKQLGTYSGRLSIDPGTIKLTRFSIQFSFTNGMDVDMLPASADIDSNQALQAIEYDPRKRRLYSSSLVDRQVDFMKDQDSSTHDFVRFVKCWFKSMDLGGNYVSGGSSIFECLAVAAVLEGRAGNPAVKEVNFVDAFLRVINKVENFDRLMLAFGKTGSGKNWKVADVPATAKDFPYLIEPANPYNNLLAGMKPEVIQIFKENGRTMRTRFLEWMKDANKVTFDSTSTLFP